MLGVAAHRAGVAVVQRGRELAGHVLDAQLGQAQMLVGRGDIAVERLVSIRACPRMLVLGRGQLGARPRLRDELLEPRGRRLEQLRLRSRLGLGRAGGRQFAGQRGGPHRELLGELTGTAQLAARVGHRALEFG